jgi:hypothetical protein
MKMRRGQTMWSGFGLGSSHRLLYCCAHLVGRTHRLSVLVEVISLKNPAIFVSIMRFDEQSMVRLTRTSFLSLTSHISIYDSKFANRSIPDFFLPVARVSEANVSGFGMPKS